MSYIHTSYIYVHVSTYLYMFAYTHIGITLRDTKTAPYCYFISSKL